MSHQSNYKALFGRCKTLMGCEFYCPDDSRPFPQSIHHFDVSSFRQLESLTGNVEMPKRYPPLICHIVTEHNWDGGIVDLIHDETNLPYALITELIEFGSVYLRAGNAGKGSLLRTSGSPEKREVISDNAQRLESIESLGTKSIPAGSYIRVHVNPNRYYGGYNVDWSTRIFTPMGRRGTIIVVDKPYDLPTMEITSSRKENLAHEVAKFVGRDPIKTPVHVVSRLDACTSGLIPFALNAKAASAICKAISKNEVSKKYKVLVHGMNKDTAAPMLGSIKHCFRRIGHQSSSKKPTLLREFNESLLTESRLALKANVSAGMDWQLAELNILSCREINASDLQLGPLRWNNFDLSSSISEDPLQQCKIVTNTFFECIVELVTGRTHQIRLQFAAMGFPVVGDSRYVPVAGLLDNDDDTYGDGSQLFGPDPRVIGLQCFELRIPDAIMKEGSNSVLHDDDTELMCSEFDDKVTFECGPPWWVKASRSDR